MRIMVDTNVIISAILSSKTVNYQLLNKIFTHHDLIICDYIINECYEVANRKFPSKINELKTLFSEIRCEVILTSPKSNSGIKMADIKDQPILETALDNGVDIIISGDKHFLNLGIEYPEILTPKQFIVRYP